MSRFVISAIAVLAALFGRPVGQEPATVVVNGVVYEPTAKGYTGVSGLTVYAQQDGSAIYSGARAIATRTTGGEKVGSFRIEVPTNNRPFEVVFVGRQHLPQLVQIAPVSGEAREPVNFIRLTAFTKDQFERFYKDKGQYETRKMMLLKLLNLLRATTRVSSEVDAMLRAHGERFGFPAQD